MDVKVQQSILNHLREFSTAERPIYAVGGIVRDILLGRPVHDLDFVVAGATRKLAKELACRMNGALYMLDEERDTARVILDPGDSSRLVVDFASLRGTDLETDLRGRDFTVNAMAFDVAKPDRLIDPLGGLADLREKRLRACAPDSFTRDPVRVLRAVRQSLSFHFRIEADTLQSMRAAAPLLPAVSAERQRDELFRMLEGEQVALAVRILDRVGALQHVLPELTTLKQVEQPPPHTQDVWEHTLSVVQALERLLPPLVGAYQEEKVPDLTVGSVVLWLGRFREQFAEHFRRSLVPDRSVRALLFFGALYHDAAKPQSRTTDAGGRQRFFGHDTQGAELAERRARALALSVVEIDRVKAIVAHHMRVHQLSGAFHAPGTAGGTNEVSRRAIYRFFKDTGQAGVDICLLSLADLRGTYGAGLPQDAWEAELKTCRALLEAYWEKSAEVVTPPRLLTGRELIHQFHLEPGPIIGRLLDAIREAQAAGEVQGREEALEFAGRWLANNKGVQDDG